MNTDTLRIELSAVKRTIPLASFLTVAQNTMGILQGLDAAISGVRGGAVVWEIGAVSMRSPIVLQVVGDSARTPEVVPEVIGACVEGMNCIEEGTGIPPLFDDAMVGNAKAIAGVAADDVADVTLSAGSLVAKPTKRLIANAEDLMRTSQSITSFEGTLETLSIHGGYQFNIYDALSGRRIECHFTGALLEDAKQAFGRRVKVYGVGRFDHAGAPLSMRVDEMRVQRDQSELPQFKDLEGIDITRGVDPTEYVRRLRDAG